MSRAAWAVMAVLISLLVAAEGWYIYEDMKEWSDCRVSEIRRCTAKECRVTCVDGRKVSTDDMDVAIGDDLERVWGIGFYVK